MLNYFLNFDKLLGTKLIIFLYYIGIIGIVLGALAGVFGGLATMFNFSFFGGLTAIFMSLLGAVLGLLFWRFICELYLLLFRMADDVREIKLGKTGQGQASEF